MTDFWLSKLMFDLQAPENMARWRADPNAVLEGYKLRPEIRQAVLDNDVPVLAPRVNAYLLRFYLSASGLDDAELIAELRALLPKEETANG